MNPPNTMDIRSERSGDRQTIHRLTSEAFAPMAFSDGTEAAVIDRLRAAGDLTLSLVAVEDDELLGHVAFSPVSIGVETNGWFGLGPISVWPRHQRRGIGSALANEGLKRLRDRGAAGCALIGDPGYYSRFGFRSDDRVHYQDLPSKHVQWISFTGRSPTGELVFSPAFDD